VMSDCQQWNNCFVCAQGNYLITNYKHTTICGVQDSTRDERLSSAEK